MRWGIALVGLVLGACGAVDSSVDAAMGAEAPGVPASCDAIHVAQPALPSGMYEIDPDGAGGDAPFMAACDMMTDGGGWTIVFHAPTTNLVATPLSYTTGTPRLMADARFVLLAYRSLTLVAYVDHARFDLPMVWRTTAPFNFPGDDLTTGVSINGGALSTATIRYGRRNFPSACDDAWSDPTAGDYGRICIVGTRAPYFSGFAVDSSDLCSDSMSAYNATSCTDDRRFSIAVR